MSGQPGFGKRRGDVTMTLWRWHLRVTIHQVVEAVAVVLAAVDMAYGISLITSPAQRLSAPGLQTAFDAMPAAGWGVLILAIGVIAAATHGITRSFALVAGAAWHAWWTAELIVAAAQHPNVGYLTIITYSGWTVMHLLVGVGRAVR